MTNEKIFKKAIEKATKNGFIGKLMNYEYIKSHNKYFSYIFGHDFAKAFWGKEKLHKCGGNILVTKFFAGGEETSNKYCEICDKGFDDQAERVFYEEDLIESYKFHLQQMVLEEDPIKYLEQFIN